MSSSNQTPLMKQYWEIKSLHEDKILLFRMGDFFEMFFDDAVTAAPLLGIALTQRNKKGGDETPMCGMPHHSVAGPINKLLAAGHKVAICDQIEDPKMAKGLVKRAVTRILTPGMVYDLETLDGQKPHYLAAYDGAFLSFLDTTTGEAFWVPAATERDVLKFFEVIPVVEMVLASTTEFSGLPPGMTMSCHDELSAPGPLLPPQAPESASRLLSYVSRMSGPELLSTLQTFQLRRLEGRLHLSGTVLRHLEIFQTYKGEGTGSLLSAMDRTKTSAGHRRLRQWLSFPLTEQEAIERRLAAVALWRERTPDLKRLREILGKMGDLERRLGKVPLPTCNGRDLLSLAQSMEAGLAALSFVGQAHDFQALSTLGARIQETLVEDPPISTKQGHLIRKGFRADLDEIIDLSTNAHQLLAQMEAREREASGIPSLKIRYNGVFGYYIEITNTHKDRAPSHYQRKQTLANAERYCTDELVELERKVLSAQSRRNEMESEIFDELKATVLKAGHLVALLADRCAELDVITALAWLSLEKNYSRPRFDDEWNLSLRASRHPVVEQTVKTEFVANDLGMDRSQCLLLTGPNMAGKSTLMRQVALTALMAQVGSFVPALEARLPIFDAIYTRIGASDQLSEGLSTFMVEMTETAAMLKNATSKSLVILDEVGRGTSTFDGMCLAQAILEFLLKDVRCLTLFATHYHELTSLERIWPQVKNAHMSVSDRGGEIRFLHTLSSGPAMKSYGVQVAQLAGLPLSVTKRAKDLLREIERQGPAAGAQLSLGGSLPASFENEDSERDEALKNLIGQIRSMPISQLTPLEALNRLASLQESCHGLS